MWALTLFVCAIAAHAVLVVWARTVVGRQPLRTLALALVAFFACIALFGPRENFGYTSFELTVVSLGAAMYVGIRVVARVIPAGRKREDKDKDKDKDKDSDSDSDNDNDNDNDKDKDKDKDGDGDGDGGKGTGTGESRRGRREVLVRSGGGLSWVAGAGTLAWGSVRGRHDFRLVEVPVRIVGLPRSLDGYSIVQISDLHIGEFVGEADIARGLEIAKGARGDLLVFTGDLVDFDERFAPMIATRIAGIAPRDGVVGILGNHDYYSDAAAVRAALGAAGIDVLVNERRIMRASDHGGFALLGLDDYHGLKYGARGPDLAGTLATLEGAAKEVPRILLAHQPRQFDEAAGKIALQLSGHTHGLQLDFAAVLGRMAQKYVAGRYEKDGSVLWVNSGFGVTGPPSRVGVPPEISKIVLVSA